MIKECGINEKDIYVVGGYRHEELKGLVPNLIINHEYDRKDNSYSLGLALQYVYDQDVLIMDSDLCFEKELLQEILDDPEKNVLMSMKSADQDESTGIVTMADHRISAVGKQYKNTGFVYISIFKIDKRIISEFRELLLNEKSEKTWYPLAITMLADKYPFYNHVTKHRWHEIDFRQDYFETLELFGLE